MSTFLQDKQESRLRRICLSKVAHRYMTSAEYALNEMVRLPNSVKLHIYTCSICGLFHIGKMSDYQSKKEKEESKQNN